jgi:CheY-like chemotaxis protein
LVALRLLEKHGYAVTVAANGKKALEALEKDSYEVVLMDIQMPEMNGLEATQAIRQKEKVTGDHIPIVAMTAHAMKGDQDRCLAVGMDYYLTKPIRTLELLETLERIGKSRPAPANIVDPPSRNPCGQAIDLAAALERLDGDRALFDELAHLFLQECPKNVAAMRRAIVLRDARSLELHAHALKGSSATLGAFAVSRAAEEVERLAQSDNVANAGDQFGVLQEEIDRLFGELGTLRPDSAPRSFSQLQRQALQNVQRKGYENGDRKKT